MLKKWLTALLGTVLLFGCIGLGACDGEKKDMTDEEGNGLIERSELKVDHLADYTNLYGRVHFNENLDGYSFYNAASGFEVRFVGTSLTVRWQTAAVSGYQQKEVSVLIDGERDPEANVVSIGGYGGKKNSVLVEGLPEGAHTVKVLKRHSSYRGFFNLFGMVTDGYFTAPPSRPQYALEVYGDSITCGEGVLRTVQGNEALGGYTALTESALSAYACVAADAIGAEISIFGRGGIALNYTTQQYTVYNNYNSIAVDLPAEEYPYDYASYAPDAVVIYLGTNDYNIGNAAGTFNMTGFGNYMKKFIREALAPRYGAEITIVLCHGMMVPNSGLGVCLEGVKEQLLSEFPNIRVVGFQATPYGHPVASECRVAGELLATELRDLLGIAPSTEGL